MTSMDFITETGGRKTIQSHSMTSPAKKYTKKSALSH